MTVIRVNHTDNYTVMSNYHLRDKGLSLKAKGLLSQMLSLPPAWDYTIAGLVAINQERESAIVSTLRELKEKSYLVVTKKMPNETQSGRIEYVYDIYEQPQKLKQEGKKQGLEIQGVEIQGVENQVQLNKDILSTDELSTDNNKHKRFVPPTVEEVKAYCKERRNSVDAEAFIAYYDSQDWKKANGQKVANWKSCVITFEKHERKQQYNPNWYGKQEPKKKSKYADVEDGML